MKSLRLTAIIHFEDGGYVSLCPELSVASCGDSIEEARDNLQEAVELYLECAEPEEYEHLRNEFFVTRLEIEAA